MGSKKNKWYLKWQNALNSIDGLVKLKLARGNFSLNRILTEHSLKSNNDLIKKLINNENTNVLIIVVAEPKMIKSGKLIYLHMQSTTIKVENFNHQFIEINSSSNRIIIL